MGERVMQVVLAIVAAGGLSALIMLVQRRKNRDGWAGTVSGVDTQHLEYGDGYTRDVIVIKYIRDDGEIHSLEVDPSSFPFWFKNLQLGDRLVKAPGAGMPKHIPRSGC